MITGECRVEAVGLPSGQQLALEGLRLRLDLRIVPGKEDASAAATWRVEDGRIRTLRLGVPEVYQRAAMLAGAGVLVVALVFWFAGLPPSEGEIAPKPASPVITKTVTPRVEPSTGGAGPIAREPAVGVSRDVAPAAAPPTAAPAAASPAEAATPAREPALPQKHAAAPVPEEAAAEPRPRPAAVRGSMSSDLDLFSDPK